MRELRKLVKQVRALDQQVDEKYARWQEAQAKSRKEKLQVEFKKMDKKLQDSFPKFFYKQRVLRT